MHDNILSPNPSAELRVYALWFNMYPGDHRSKWDQDLLADPRVMRFWDEGKVVGRWFVEHGIVDYAGDVLWDAYLLFGPEAVWTATPLPLLSWGQPVYLQLQPLEAAIHPFLRECPKKP